MEANGSDKPSSLERQIIRQIEYYFGDTNLRRDRFLQEKVKEDDGWVPMELMVRFNRLKSMSEDANVILGALAKSNNNLMEISEDKSKIRRNPSKPIPRDTTENRKDIRDRSVYCKGFPADGKLDDIQGFFDKFGDTENIYMRRDADKLFKGSVFVTYKESEAAKAFVQEDGVKYGEEELIRMYKEDYFLKKTEERKQKREDDKQKKQDEKDRKEKEAIQAQKEDFGDYDKGCILYFGGASAQTSREDLKEFFSEYGTVSWIDFVRGQTEGHIRFDKDTPAATVVEKANAANDNKLVVRGCELETRLLEGDEEATHWAKIHESMSLVRYKKQQGRKGKFSKGRPPKDKGPRGDFNQGARYQGVKKVFKEDSDGEAEGEPAAHPEVKPEVKPDIQPQEQMKTEPVVEPVKPREEPKEETEEPRGTKRPLETEEPRGAKRPLETEEPRGTKRPLETEEMPAKQSKTEPTG